MGQNGFLVTPRSGMQFLKLGVFPLKARISGLNLSHLSSPTEQKGHQRCVHVAVPSHFRVGLLPITTSSGISALKKGSLWVPLHTSQDAWLLSKSLQALLLERVWRQENPLTLLVGLQTSTATMENRVEIP